jgi:hypothetical protein
MSTKGVSNKERGASNISVASEDEFVLPELCNLYIMPAEPESQTLYCASQCLGRLFQGTHRGKIGPQTLNIPTHQFVQHFPYISTAVMV